MKQSWREKVKQLHPDTNGGDTSGIAAMHGILKRRGRIQKSPPASPFRVRHTNRQIVDALKRHGGNILLAALHLGCSYKKIQERRRSLSISGALALCLLIVGCSQPQAVRPVVNVPVPPLPIVEAQASMVDDVATALVAPPREQTNILITWDKSPGAILTMWEESHDLKVWKFGGFTTNDMLILPKVTGANFYRFSTPYGFHFTPQPFNPLLPPDWGIASARTNSWGLPMLSQNGM